MRHLLRIVAASILLLQSALACEAVADSSRIAVAGGSLTEIIFLLGAQARIVAVDTTSTYPQAASAYPSVGYVRALSAEGLLSLKPTLVLGEDDMGPPGVLAQVEQAGVHVIRVAEVHTAAGILDKVRCVATALGLAERGESLIQAELKPRVAALESLRVPPSEQPRAVLLLQISAGAPTAAGAGTSGDGFLRMASVRNAFADVTGWKPMSAEAMARAGPDYVVVTERITDSGGGAGADRRSAPGRRRQVRFDLRAGADRRGSGPALRHGRPTGDVPAANGPRRCHGLAGGAGWTAFGVVACENAGCRAERRGLPLLRHALRGPRRDGVDG